MTIRLFNTATGRKEDFTPIAPPAVTMYNCGPTVYDHFHLGNARNFVVVDVVRRHLAYRGYQVRFVQNFTDVDDKIIRRANETGEPWDALARRFEEVYFQNADKLGVRRADVHPRATEHIDDMLAIISKLIDKGLAYATPSGDVYYRVRAFADYGKLSGRNVDDLLEGARVDPGEQKNDPLDFALWKSAKPGEPFWTSPWGNGRPGWHIECSAMSMRHLGETIDIHSGGSDLVFPHHENECAQSCGATGHAFVRYWLHNGFLTINKEKMSKSGNFFKIEEVLEHYAPAAVRFFLLSAHYRNPLEYSPEALDEAQAAINRIREAVVTAQKLVGGDTSAPAPALLEEFDASLDDDFNCQQAIGVMFRAVGQLNEARQAAVRDGKDSASAALARTLASTVLAFLDRLGLSDMLFAADTSSADAALNERLLDLLVLTRAEARKAKQFALGDLIRDQLAGLGIRLQDHPTGTIWIKD